MPTKSQIALQTVDVADKIVFGFAKSPPRVYWDGKVKIKFDPKIFSFGFSIKTVS